MRLTTLMGSCVLCVIVLGADARAQSEGVTTLDFGRTRVTGSAGADSFSARAGSDTLWGAGGVDTLWGGTGADTFIFREAGTANADTIGDWASGSRTCMAIHWPSTRTCKTARFGAAA